MSVVVFHLLSGEVQLSNLLLCSIETSENEEEDATWERIQFMSQLHVCLRKVN